MRIGAFAAAAVFCAALCGCSADTPQTTRTVFVMDTAASVKGTAEDVERAIDTLTELGGLFDRYDPDSDVYCINKRLDRAVSDDTGELVRKSMRLGELYGDSVSIFAGDITDAWNITADNPQIPSDEAISGALESFRNASFSLETMSFADENGSIDLGCVAKGYALDKVKERLGEDSCVVSMSSSILLHGKKPGGGKFSVAIRDPADGGSTLGTLYTDECFLSTSGGYERFFEADGKRYIHIFDLSTGKPCETDLTSVTVMCGSGIESDFLSTLIFIGGTERLGEFIRDPALKIVAVTDSNVVYISEGVELTLAEGCGYTVKVWEER